MSWKWRIAVFGKTDSERAWSWLSSFTESKHDGSENYKDFGTRFARCVARLNAHGLTLSESIVSHRAIQALLVPDGQLPILLATLETFPNPTSVGALKSLTIKMYETHRGELDSSEVFAADLNAGNDNDSSDEEEVEFTDDTGGILLLKPKKATKSRTSRETRNRQNADR